MRHSVTKTTKTFAISAALLVASLTAAMQTSTAQITADNRADAYVSIDAITTAVYETISGPAGQERDWDFFKTLFAPGARLIPLGVRAGEPNRLNPMSVEDYPKMVDAYFFENGFFEVEIARKTEQFGSIAHHFSTYESRRNADDIKPFTRGINSMQLMHDGDRWWIVTIFWQSESPEVPIPSQYLK